MHTLQNFIDWLQTDLTHFVALAKEGSDAAGDPWQEGFSDHDLSVIVSQDAPSEMRAVFDYLAQHPLGNEYLIGIDLAEDFAHGDRLHDISMKFRANVIAGTDVIATKALPDQDKALVIGKDGLRTLVPRFERRWINLAQWTNDYAAKKNYDVYKAFFVFYAAFQYGKTGLYPTTRADAAALIHNHELAGKLLHAANNIGSVSKPEQKAAIEAALELIPSILSVNDIHARP